MKFKVKGVLANLKIRLVRLWTSSLMSRVVISTVFTSVLISLIGGFLISNQVTAGVFEGKKQNSQLEAATALSRMQSEILGMDLASDATFERLSTIAERIGSEPSQYSIVLEAGPSIYLYGGVKAKSVPDELKEQVAQGGSGLWVTSTEISYEDESVVPGIAIGSNLQTNDGREVPIYFLFPLNNEIQTLTVVKQALYSVGLVLLLALAATMWLISRQVASPVIEARNVAQRIAEGDLDERLQVSGDDEIADLGRSMNSMASTLQNQISRLENLSSMQQQFVSDVSHELRTPLTTMRMGIDMLYADRDELDAVKGRTVELLHGEIDRFARLLADLLEISRFDAGAELLSLEETDLAELVSEEIAGLGSLSDELETPIEFSAHGNCLALCDPRRIKRVVRNLITNALEHGEKQTINLRCQEGNKCVQIEVVDHGIGLTEEQLTRVFDRFWRANPSRTRTVGGTGLGLSIAKADANLHGGELVVESAYGEGTTFTLTLPKTAEVSDDSEGSGSEEN